jgi:two-component system chemotaxis sensor kinase CheA
VTRGTGKRDGVGEEFVSEAQEIIETLSRDLLVLDHTQKEGAVDPDTLNDLFRGVHTLKGLSGMFGFARLGELAHCLEDLLEDLRLGRASLTQEALDLLFEGVDAFQKLLAQAKDAKKRVEVDVERFRRIAASLATQERRPPGAVIGEYDIDSEVLSVLTEYETHRLRANLEQGIPIYRFQISVQLDVIDVVLKELKERSKKLAEIITYLPSMATGTEQVIDIEVLMASRAGESELRSALGRPDLSLNPIRRRGARGSLRPASPAPARGAPVTVSGPPPFDAEGEVRGEPLAVREQAAEQLSLRSVMNTVRVDIRKLDLLMNTVGELGTVRGALRNILEGIDEQTDLRKLSGALKRLDRDFERCLGDVQGNVLEARMVPLGHFFSKVARVVRQVARENRKEVRLVVTGSETEVDKLIAEELADPLMHIVRNAIDHGIEPPTERDAFGKPVAGTLAINAYHRGNQVIIEVEDDGRGIDRSRLAEEAVSRNLLSRRELEEMTAEQLLQTVFLPGMSTAGQVTELSGRGVGMDVVKTNVSRLGGTVELQSDPGVGTKVSLTVPITLAIVQALIVEVAGRTMAVPLSAVREVFRLEPLQLRKVEGRETFTLRGSSLPVCHLSERLGFESAGEGKGAAAPERPRYAIVAVHGQRRLGFTVDRISEQRDIIIKSLGSSLKSIRGVAGATDLGDQSLVLVLDPPVLIEDFFASGRAAAEAGATA